MGILYEAVAATAQFFDDAVLLVLFMFLSVLVFEKRWGKRKKIILALCVAAVLAFSVKFIVDMPRPCTGSGSLLVACPGTPAFPSGHAAVAFTLMLGFMGKRVFPLFWLFAIYIAFTRLFLGLHTFDDIAGGLVIAPIAYHITDIVWGGKK